MQSKNFKTSFFNGCSQGDRPLAVQLATSVYINTKASFSLKQYWHFTGISLHPTSNRHQMSKCTIFNCFPHNRVVSCSSVCIIIIQFCSVVNNLPSPSAYKMIQFFSVFFYVYQTLYARNSTKSCDRS